MKQVIERFSDFILDYSLSESLLPHQRVVRAWVQFTDQSVLVIQQSEFFDTGRQKYSFHWMSETGQLLVRWDNAHDYPDLDTSPFHQHVGTEANVRPSEPMTLETVLRFIAAQLTSS